ncbi:MAG TPA: succinylglutamate desuccinylase/aspartoacylase family protein [Thermomicrobiales bacterium]|jgi:predicted deacylase
MTAEIAFPWTFVPAPAPGERRADYFSWPDAIFGETRWPFFAVRGREPGPTVAIVAAIHGGEYPGPLGALRLAREIDSATVRGALLILPLVNLSSFWARRAFVTPEDGRNLNRVFPGKADGTLSEVLAWRIMTDVLAPADAIIDLHSGDIFEALADHTGRYQSGDAAQDARSAAMAAAFGLPYDVVWARPTNPGGLVGNTTLRGKPSLLVEVGGNGLASAADEANVYNGLLNTLRALGSLPGDVAPAIQQQASHGAGVAAPATGLWRAVVALEQQVAAGEFLGTLTDPLGNEIARIVAPVAGMVLYYMTSLAVQEGDPLVTLVVVGE